MHYTQARSRKTVTTTLMIIFIHRNKNTGSK